MKTRRRIMQPYALALNTRRAVQLVLPASGALAVSASQFLLIYTLLRRLPGAEFGGMAFMLVGQQFLIGCWGALFSAPLLSQLSSASCENGRLHNHSVLFAAVAITPITALGVTFVGYLIGLAIAPSFIFATFTCVVLVRNFARSWALGEGKREKVLISDFVFSFSLIVVGLLCWRSPHFDFRAAAIGQMGAAIVASVIFLPKGQEWLSPSKSLFYLRTYGQIWRKDARWSLTGVLASELTANAHSYIIVALFGAGAFAPIAASALLIRPILVLINPLVEFERVRMAQSLGRRDFDDVRFRRVTLLRTLVMGWGVTVCADVLLLGFLGSAVVQNKVAIADLWLLASLWLAIALGRSLHSAQSAAFQAMGQFRYLANAALVTAGISLSATFFAAWMGGVNLSLAGVVLGEAAYAFALFRSLPAQIQSFMGSSRRIHPA